MKSSVVQGMKLQKFKEILISNMIVSKETILAWLQTSPECVPVFWCQWNCIQLRNTQVLSN